MLQAVFDVDKFKVFQVSTFTVQVDSFLYFIMKKVINLACFH